MTRRVRKSVAALGLAASIACGTGEQGGPNPPPPPPPPPPPAVASVEVSPQSATIPIDGTASFTATVRDAGGNPLTGRTVAWTSANPALASVSSAGVVTGGAAGGPVTITATSEGRSGTATVTVEAPVASVTVTPEVATVLVGETSAFTATPRDAAGNPLPGRTVAWASNNPSVATVSPAGVVTGAAAGGPVTITATSEGRSGTATVTVLAPVASVTISGTFRIKVGDTYQYDAVARLSDGTVVTRPMTWSVAEPAGAAMTQAGMMTPLLPGPITIQVTIDGVVWEGTASAYDWLPFGGGSVFGVGLAADVAITNKFGASEFADLAMGCSGGQFLLFVDTEHFVTASGLVTYGFDNQPFESDSWLEFDLFSALGHPGPESATRGFAARLAAVRQFWFAFTEFNGPAKATMFRVTGLAARLQAFASCPAPVAVNGDASAGGLASRLQAMVTDPAPLTPERALRAAFRSALTRAPDVRRQVAPPTSRPARRRVPPR